MKFASWLYFTQSYILLQCVNAQLNKIPFNPHVNPANAPVYNDGGSSANGNYSLSSVNGNINIQSLYGITEAPFHNTYHDRLHGRRIVCLYNNVDYYSTGFKPSMIDALICTHLNYEFAMLDPKTYEIIPGEPSLDIQDNFYGEIVELKQKNPILKVMLSLGGWKDSTKKYSELVESPSKVENFIEKTVHFLKIHDFDGLDVAWEYPNCWKGAIGISPNDKENFGIFLQKIRKRFDTENLLLSISVSAVKREIEAAYDGPAIAKAVHYINVMTYDMHGPWEKVTGHHAPFEKEDDDDDTFLNAKSALEFWVSLGVDRRKLNMGIPTYAKTFTLLYPDTHGIGAPAKGPGKAGPTSKQAGVLCWSEICQYLNSGNWTEDEDPGHGYYAYSGDQWACYDPPMMGVRKAKWVIQSGYGGVLIKDCSCDDFKALCSPLANKMMRMIRMEIIRKIRFYGG